MTISDTLSRNLLFAQGNETDIEYTLLLSDYLFVSTIDLSLSKCIKDAANVNPGIQEALE